jgi:hypothetical protein
MWVTSEVAGVVTVIDAKTRKIIKTIGFAIPGVQPEYIQPVPRPGASQSRNSDIGEAVAIARSGQPPWEPFSRGSADAEGEPVGRLPWVGRRRHS